jgi:hypothetical protein
MRLFIKSDFAQAAQRLAEFENPNQFASAALFTLLAKMKRRIFEEGLNSENQQIGTYSQGYVEYRQEAYNWSDSSRVILELTGQMREDFVVGEGPEGFGLGWQNPFNAEKAAKNESRYGIVFDPTNEEIQEFVRILSEEINRSLTK